MQNYQHLTRWVAPYPPVHPQYHADTPINVSNNKIKKVNHICTFHSYPSYRHPDRHTDAPTCMIVAPESLLLSAKFQP